VLRRIDHDGAYANVLLPNALRTSALSERDRGFTTELVYGTTRMRRACDVLVDRFVAKEPSPEIRTLLRMGAYQLFYLGVAAHAGVGETVELAPEKVKGFVNAVLRRVAATPMTRWPSEAARLSYPDWIVARMVAELGEADALTALARMDEAPPVTARDDGYVQDLASQWVGALVDAQPGDRIVDLCAAPGGKATALAGAGAHVVACDLQPHRARLVVGNARRIGVPVPVVVADAAAPPFAAGAFDRVLVDAPCSGLGALRRRPDARWRITAADIDDLAGLQGRILEAAAALVRPGGLLVYSVCTLTAVESIDHPVPAGFTATPAPGAPWSPYGDGARLLPQDADTDGMIIRRWRRRP